MHRLRVEGTRVSYRRHWLLLAGNEGREKREGNSGKGTFIIGNIYKICTALDLSMHETLIRCMHEK
jgi:hypothetical protein